MDRGGGKWRSRLISCDHATSGDVPIVCEAPWACVANMTCGQPSRRDGNRTEPICISRHLYRSLIGRAVLFNKIKQCWRVVTRYDKLAANYLAFTQLVSTRLWLRVDGVRRRARNNE